MLLVKHWHVEEPAICFIWHSDRKILLTVSVPGQVDKLPHEKEKYMVCVRINGKSRVNED
jgi:thiamine kinase-like enzyme